MLEWVKKILTRDQGTPPLFPFTEAEIEFYLLSVYTGIITKNNLSVEYHYRIAAYIEQAVREGFGASLESLEFVGRKYQVMRAMRSNIYVFSAAKQYSQVREMSAFINIRGEVSQFKEFRELAEGVFDTYNRRYLRTEYNTAVGQSQMASQWVDFEEQQQTLPMLTYRTQRDARVRDEHAILDGITLPVGHKFWNDNAPKNGWNCRCFLTQHDENKKATKDEDIPNVPWGDKEFPKVFRMNPGKDGIIFDPKRHPYFHVAKGDAGFREANYNMPVL